jgi:hypothetical protein
MHAALTLRRSIKSTEYVLKKSKRVEKCAELRTTEGHGASAASVYAPLYH